MAVSRVVASYFSLYDFVLLYLLALTIAVSLAILIVRRRLELSLSLSNEVIEIPAARRRRLYALLTEIENAMSDRGDADRQLRANYSAKHEPCKSRVKAPSDVRNGPPYPKADRSFGTRSKRVRVGPFPSVVALDGLTITE